MNRHRASNREGPDIEVAVVFSEASLDLGEEGNRLVCTGRIGRGAITAVYASFFVLVAALSAFFDFSPGYAIASVGLGAELVAYLQRIVPNERLWAVMISARKLRGNSTGAPRPLHRRE